MMYSQKASLAYSLCVRDKSLPPNPNNDEDALLGRRKAVDKVWAIVGSRQYRGYGNRVCAISVEG